MSFTQNWGVCNSSLLEGGTIEEQPLWQNGIIFHHLALFICAIFGGISVIIALILVFRHATHYLRPWEQRHIIRILLMIPIYSVVSFLSYLYYRRSVYFEVLRDCYEAFAIASFFTLLCHYVAPTLHDQKDYFRTLTPVNWFWGVFGLQYCTGGENKGPFRKPRSGLTWFNVVWVGVFQYCFIRVIFTIVSVAAQATDRYCEESLSPAFAHVWVTAFECASVFIAMFCLVQFYIQLRFDLAEHKPFLKVLCIKLVIFFSFWQTEIISLVSSSDGPFQPTPQIAYQDIKVGIPNVLLCIEMAIFSVMHIFAFPIRPYNLKYSSSDGFGDTVGFGGEPLVYKGGPLGLYALVDALNPWDIIKASARGFRWLFVGVKTRERDVSYHPSKLNGATAYSGPTYAGTGDAATELRPHDDDDALARARRETPGLHGSEDDRAGLLRNSAIITGRGADNSSSTAAAPYPTYANEEYASGDDAHYDLGASHRSVGANNDGMPTPGMFASEQPPPAPAPQYGELEDTSYHPGFGGRDGAHPTMRDQHGAVPPPQWDHWAGAAAAAASSDDGAESVRPPTYRTQDPRG